MKPIIKKRVGKVKYPARKQEIQKSIKFEILAEKEAEFDPRIHFLAKMTQNGNYFIRGENVSFEGFFWGAFWGYINSNMEVLRRTYADEIEFVDGWEQPWIVIKKEKLYEKRMDVIVNVISGFDNNDDMPCDQVYTFLLNLDRKNQGKSYELYVKRILIYRKKKHWHTKYMAWLKAKSSCIVICPLYLYGLTECQVDTIKEHFDIRIN